MEQTTNNRKCRYCGNEFAPVSKIHSFCSDQCRKAMRGSDYRKAREKALFRDGFICTEPDCTADTHLECHHIIPLYLGGDHSLDNLQTLCHKHHREKHKSFKRLEVTSTNDNGTERTRAGQSEEYDNAA